MPFTSPGADGWKEFPEINLSLIKDVPTRQVLARINQWARSAAVAPDPTVQQADIDTALTHVTSSGSDHTWLDQDVTTDASPTFATVLHLEETITNDQLDIRVTGTSFSLQHDDGLSLAMGLFNGDEGRLTIEGAQTNGQMEVLIYGASNAQAFLNIESASGFSDNDGGMIRLHNAPQEDSNAEYWQMEARDIFRLGILGVAATTNFNLFEVDTAGYVNCRGSYEVDGTQVVTNQQTGWATPTGTQTRSTFATSTVTLPQLAERVYALIVDLETHGLID